jgi:hypothetical protein
MPAEHLLSRSGALLDLTIERHLAGELSEADAALVEAHLASHPACRARHEAAARDRAAFRQRPVPVWMNAPPPAHVAEVVPLRPARRTWAYAGAVALAAAALLAVLVGLPAAPDTAPDVVRVRGDGLELGVYTEDSTPLEFGSDVATGARLGFRIRSREAGHLVIVGVDDAGGAYPCYPQGGGSAPVEAHTDPVSLDEAIRLDGTPGTERLVALRCAAPIDPAHAQERLVEEARGARPDELLPTLIDGCAQDEVLVHEGGR